MSRIRRALRRNYDRYLWLELRHDERSFARERSKLGRFGDDIVPCQVRLIVAIMRNADQCHRFLGLDRGLP